MIRIGVDFGGTKIEAAALDAEGRFVARVRAPTPEAYDDRLEAVRALVEEAERQAGVTATAIGVGGPGSPSPRGRRITYCSPTALRVATAASVSAGIGSAPGSIVSSTRTPSSTRSMSVTRPTATPR